ncbi:ALP1-like protein isoform X1 [Tanacetum coccineum]
MASLTGCSPGSLLFDYLGLPIGSNMNNVSRWNTLVDRFRAKLSSWKANLLSISGHLTLLKTVSPIKAIHREDGGLDSTRCAMHGTWANMVASIHALHSSDIIPNNTIWPIEGGRTGGMLVAMMDGIQHIDQTSELDSWQWLIGKDGVFTVGDTRKHIENAILPVSQKESISPLIKCTSVIRQLAYGVNASFLDEYMQISERSSRMALDHFCQAVREIYGPEFLRKSTVTDIEKFYRHHEEKHGFPGMLGSLDCTDWEWFGCLYAFKAQYVRRDHGPNPFILLEAVASQYLWTWHAFFGVSGSNNDINVLYQSHLFNNLKTGRALEILFVANDVTYRSGYYLVDGIYPELAPLVKTIPEPADDDHKRILYKQKQESVRKDVERAFGVLKKK